MELGEPRPNGIEYEVMDMIYGLPFRDWLGDWTAPAASQPARRDGNAVHADNERRLDRRLQLRPRSADDRRRGASWRL